MQIEIAYVIIWGLSSGFTTVKANAEANLLTTKKYGIDFAIVSNSDAWEVHHKQILLPEELQVSQEDALERTIQFARKNPGKMKKNLNYIY